MNATGELYGLGITALSVIIAALTSGLRLKPYLDAGVERTPLTFATYPALIAAAVAIVVVSLIRWWTGKKAVDVGPVTFTGNLPFIALGCFLYAIIAVAFFPYEAPPKPLPKGAVQTRIVPDVILVQQRIMTYNGSPLYESQLAHRSL